MIAVISPAKSLDFDLVTNSQSTEVRFQNETQQLVNEMQTKSAEDIKSLMSVSDKIADLNVERYYSFGEEYVKDKNAKHALYAFTGDVYQGMDAKSFSEKEEAFCQDHLRILSGLYGLLRPLDLIQAIDWRWGLN